MEHELGPGRDPKPPEILRYPKKNRRRVRRGRQGESTCEKVVGRLPQSRRWFRSLFTLLPFSKFQIWIDPDCTSTSFHGFYSSWSTRSVFTLVNHSWARSYLTNPWLLFLWTNPCVLIILLVNVRSLCVFKIL